AQGALLKFEVPTQALRGLLKGGALYAGIESQVELALRGAEGLKVLFDAYRGATAVAADGNMWADSDNPLWRADDFAAAATRPPAALDHGDAPDAAPTVPAEPDKIWR